MDTLTEFEKKYLKEAICNMIDEGRLYGRIDTIEMKENSESRGLLYYDFIRKEWEFSIRMINKIDYGL